MSGIDKQLPTTIRPRLRRGEVVHHFTVVEADGGKNAVRTGRQWLVVTSQRVLFGGKVRERVGDRVRQIDESCSLPLTAVSRVIVAEASRGNGEATRLTVDGRGAQIVMAFPDRKDADRMKAVLDGILPGAA